MFALSSGDPLPFSAEKPPASVCILRLSAIGDTSHMVPVVRAIQQHWPDCKITWVIGKPEYQLLQYLDGVEFIIFDKRSGFAGIREFRQQMRQRHFDLLLHMQAALRASVLASCIRADYKLGFDKARAQDFQWLFSSHKIAAEPRQHVLESFMSFLKACGMSFGELDESPDLDWRFDIPIEAIEQARILCEHSQNYLVINPCSSVRKNNWRNWPFDNYTAIIEYANARGLDVVVTGGPDDLELAIGEQICAQAASPVINLVGKTSLIELLAVLRGARVLISPDTGPGHMGSLVGIPVVGLYASCNPLRGGPYRHPQFTVNKYPAAVRRYLTEPESAVKWGQRVRHPDAMSLISPDDVLAVLKKLF